jgi:hypothetical protein
MSRPTLLPHLRPMWRDRTTLQLGTDPAHAIVVEFAAAATSRVLDLLDGSRTEAQVVRDAAAHGIPADHVLAVIGALGRAGALVAAHTLVPARLPEPARRRLVAEAVSLAVTGVPDGTTPAQLLRRRASARVWVGGGGPLRALLVDTLRAAGIGRVHAGEPGEARTRPPRDATFAVRLGPDRAPAALLARAYERRCLAHLSVWLRDATVVVGPLVGPRDSPCLNCLELHRCDRDPVWPTIAAQLPGAASAAACAITTLLAGAAYAADEVLAHLDGRPVRTRAAVVEITSPRSTRRRSWNPHPDCDCSRRRQSHKSRSELIR